MKADRAVTARPKSHVVAGAGRTAFGCLALVALAVGYDRDLHVGDAVNFFFYFTDLSNLFGAAVLLIGGRALLQGRSGVPDLVRGAAVLYLVITGLVYWTLLAGQATAATITWQNDIVHGVMPCILVLDWLLLPPTARLRHAVATRWLVFPLVYLAVSLVRGPIVTWWPYDFLDPREPGGYLHVTTWSLIVLIVFVVFMLLTVLTGNQLGSRRSPSPDPLSSTDSAEDGSSPEPNSDRNFTTRSA
ncbi:Pr6Pr family membrane protein [Actinospica robiniae]|uniref:Pr6Pr family membrane protein n=1 Tax=Actinospica robiniae TaxID=304901 RepID=UPI00054FE320|nr:Pr6Pr family membrane protein [Actinospica robiniae]